MNNLNDTRKSLDEASNSVKQFRDNLSSLNRVQSLSQFNRELDNIVVKLKDWSDLVNKISKSGNISDGFKSTIQVVKELNSALLNLKNNKNIINTESITKSSAEIKSVAEYMNKVNDAFSRVSKTGSNKILDSEYFNGVKNSITDITNKLNSLYSSGTNTGLIGSNNAYRELDKLFTGLIDKANKLNINIKNIESASRQIKSGIEKSLFTGNTDQLSKYMSQYENLGVQLSNKINGKLKSIDIATSVKSQISTIKQEFNVSATQFNSLSDKANKYGIDISNVKNNVAMLTSELNRAFNSGDVTGASNALNSYNSAIKSAESSLNSLLEKNRRIYEETKNYVSLQETLNNKKMPYADQADYYSKQLNQLLRGTNEYISVLNLKQQAEKNASQAAQDALNKQINTIRQVAQAVNSAVNNIISAIRTVISVITKVTGVASTVVKSVISGVKQIITLFSNLGNRVKSLFTGIDRGKDVSGVFNVIGLSATELRSRLLLLKGAFDSVFNSEIIQKAKDLLGSIYSMRTIVGTGMTQDTINWANSMQRAFGLNATSLISDLKEINAVLYGLGMSSEDTAIGGRNLLMLARYMASIGLAGGDAKVVMDKIVSGMKGMTSSVDDLGLSVREAQMNTFLKDLKAQGGEFANIKTDFASLNEEARVYIRYAAIIQQFTDKYDISNIVKGMDTVTGRLGMIKDYWSELLTQMGTGMATVLAKISPLIVKIITMLQSLIQSFFGLFGIDVKLGLDLNNQVSGIGDADSAVSDMNSELSNTEDALNNISSSAKKAKGSLQSFDRVNNVTSSSSGSSAGTGGIGGVDTGFDYTSLMTDMLEELNKMAKESADDYIDSIWEKFKESGKKAYSDFIKYAQSKTGRIDYDLGFDFKLIDKNLKSIKEDIIGTIRNWGNFVIEISLKVLDDFNIGKIITDITTLAASFSNLAYVTSVVLTDALTRFYDIGLSPIIAYLGNVVSGAILTVSDEFDNWAKWFDTNSDVIIEFFETLGDVVDKAFKIIEPYINDLIESIGKLFKESNENARDSLLEGMLGFISNKDTTIEYLENKLPGAMDTAYGVFESLKGILESLLEIVGDLVEKFGEFLVNEGLPWLIEKLDELDVWLKNNKDKVVELIEKIAKASWDGFKLFVDLVGKLVDFAVNNPDVVVGFFSALLGLKVASWFTDVASGIGATVLQLQLLKSLGGLKGVVGAASTAGAAGAGTAGASSAAGAAGVAGAAGAAGAAVTALPFLATAGLGIAAVVKNKEFFGDNLKQSIENLRALTDESGKAAINFLQLREAANDAAEDLNGIYGGDIIDKEAIFVLLDDIKIKLEESGKYTQEQIQTQLETFEGYLHDAGIKVVDEYGNNVDALLSKSDEFKEYIINNNSDIGGSISDLSKNVVDNVASMINTVVNESNSSKDAVISNSEQISSTVSDMSKSISNEITNIFNKVVDKSTVTKDSLIDNNNKINESTGSVVDSTTKVVEGFTSVNDEISKLGDTTPINNTKSAMESFGDVVETIGTGVGEVITLITKLPSQLSNLASSIPSKLFGGSITESYNSTISRTASVRAATITTNANGGSIAGGQLFIANEGGGAELIGNIDGTGKTNVANNKMITGAIYEAVYNAMADVHRQTVVNKNNNSNMNLNINGFGLIDRSTLSEFARMLAPYIGANNLNIANNDFSI